MIRAATPLDAGRTGAILSAFTDETEWMPRLHSRAEDLAFCSQMIDRGWVTVICAPYVVGFLARSGVVVHALYIAPEARGLGYGTALLNDAKTRSVELRLWTFQANLGAQRFYLRAGFSEIQRTNGAENDEHLPDIEFNWQRSTA